MNTSKQIKITSTSKSSAEIDPPIEWVSNDGRRKFSFHLTQVVNSKNSLENLRGKFIYSIAHKKSKNFENTKKFNKKWIKSGESFELNLDSHLTYKLWKGLNSYYDIVNSIGFNRGEKTYEISYESEETKKELIEKLKNKEYATNIFSNLENSDLKNLNFILNLNNLINIKNNIEINLNNGEEKFWQELFENNSWIISQIFTTPYMIINKSNYLGGKKINNKEGVYTDFIYKNVITNNIAIIEIKTPLTNLINTTQYRNGVYEISAEFNKAITQVLNQRDSLYKNFSLLTIDNDNDENKIKAWNFKNILIIGKFSILDKNAKKTFELL